MARWKPDAPGRLLVAAVELFAERGYDATTVAEITERAGLTKRTFFRHFADKREVLFDATNELERRWLDGIAAAPANANPLTMATAGFDPVADMFVERHRYARLRATVIAANPALQERELIKLQKLAAAINVALTERGVPNNAAVIAAQVSVTVFHVAFSRWLDQDDPSAFRQTLDESLRELRMVAAAPPEPKC